MLVNIQLVKPQSVWLYFFIFNPVLSYFCHFIHFFTVPFLSESTFLCTHIFIHKHLYNVLYLLCPTCIVTCNPYLQISDQIRELISKDAVSREGNANRIVLVALTHYIHLCFSFAVILSEWWPFLIHFYIRTLLISVIIPYEIIKVYATLQLSCFPCLNSLHTINMFRRIYDDIVFINLLNVFVWIIGQVVPRPGWPNFNPRWCQFL